MAATRLKGTKRAPELRIDAWSFSRWKDYENCPALARYRYLDKLPEEKGDALLRGGEVHSEAEAYLKADKRPKLPASLKLMAPEFAKLRKQEAESELELAFNKKWEPTGWFAPDTFVRVKIDALVHTSLETTVVDFKTGRFRGADDAYTAQVELYALAALIARDARWATAELWYVDSATIVESPDVYSRKHIKVLIDRWTQRTEAMLADREFVPKKNPLCGWCAFSKTKGGPCKLA